MMMSIRRIAAAGIALLLMETVVFAEQIQTPPFDAKAVIVMEAMTGQVLFEQAADEQLPMASTTKIMSAMLTLEQPELDTEFTVDPQAIQVEGSSMGLVEGDVVTLRSLAIGMLLPSGNDAACAAAVRISGSIPAFVAAMNQRAEQMGLSNTAFAHPAGLDGGDHYSTARDLANLTREALKHPEFLTICSQYKMRTSFGNPPYDRWLTNHNKLLNYYEGTIGVKTGFTQKAGRCLVSAAERNGVRLICVTLNCADDWNVHEQLYDQFFDQAQVEDLSADIPETAVPVTGGTVQEVAAVPYDSVQLPVFSQGQAITYRVFAPKFLYAPVKSGQYLGEVQVYLGEELFHTFSLIASADVPLLHEYNEPNGILEHLSGLFSFASD